VTSVLAHVLLSPSPTVGTVSHKERLIMEKRYIKWCVIAALGTVSAVSQAARTLTGNSTVSPSYILNFHDCFEESYGGIKSRGTFDKCAAPSGLESIEWKPLIFPLPIDTGNTHTFWATVWGQNYGADPYCYVYGFRAMSTDTPPAGYYWQAGPSTPIHQGSGFANTTSIVIPNLGMAEAQCFLPLAGQGIRSVTYVP